MFSETQRLAPWVYLLVVGGSVVAVAGVYFATRGMAEGDIVVAAIAAALALEIALLHSLKLTTRVDAEAIEMRGMWLINRRIAFAEIEHAELRKYKPLLEYGGWGFRIGPAGKAYNARGDEGVQLVLKSGERALIGSQRAAELAAILTVRLER